MFHAYNVYRDGRIINTVFHSHPKGFKTSHSREEDVKDGLINHDGYSYDIDVKEVPSRRG
jgi:hypothetical protein